MPCRWTSADEVTLLGSFSFFFPLLGLPDAWPGFRQRPEGLGGGRCNDFRVLGGLQTVSGHASTLLTSARCWRERIGREFRPVNTSWMWPWWSDWLPAILSLSRAFFLLLRPLDTCSFSLADTRLLLGTCIRTRIPLPYAEMFRLDECGVGLG